MNNIKTDHIGSSRDHDPFAIVADADCSSVYYRPYLSKSIRKIFTELSMDFWEKELCDAPYCRVHRSHFVGLYFVDGFEPDADGHGGYVLLRNSFRYRVSRTYLERFHRATNFRFASVVQKRNYRHKKHSGGGGGRKSSLKASTNTSLNNSKKRK